MMELFPKQCKQKHFDFNFIRKTILNAYQMSTFYTESSIAHNKLNSNRSAVKWYPPTLKIMKIMKHV